MAMKYYPDEVVNDERLKESAIVKFCEVKEAYDLSKLPDTSVNTQPHIAIASQQSANKSVFFVQTPPLLLHNPNKNLTFVAD